MIIIKPVNAGVNRLITLGSYSAMPPFSSQSIPKAIKVVLHLLLEIVIIFDNHRIFIVGIVTTRRPVHRTNYHSVFVDDRGLHVHFTAPVFHFNIDPTFAQRARMAKKDERLPLHQELP